MCILTAGILWNCDDSDSKVKDNYHSITAEQNEYCRIDVRQKEIAGNQVQFTVGLLDPAREITAVTYNESPCSFVSGKDAEFTYQFTMPDKEVLLAVQTRQKEIGRYAIRLTPNQFCEISGPKDAGGGNLLA